MSSLADHLPHAEVLVQMPKEELAMSLLRALSNVDKITLEGVDASLFEGREHANFPRSSRYKVWNCIASAWGWLEGQGLIISSDTMNGRNGWRKLSPEALKIVETESFDDVRERMKLPLDALHPVVAGVSASHFRRGELETAVFRAFREIEIRVRASSGSADSTIGVNLMREAFHKDNGSLTNKSLPVAEREHISQLFASSIGLFKNPHSHRDAELEDPKEAFEALMLASYLIRLVESRT